VASVDFVDFCSVWPVLTSLTNLIWLVLPRYFGAKQKRSGGWEIYVWLELTFGFCRFLQRCTYTKSQQAVKQKGFDIGCFLCWNFDLVLRQNDKTNGDGTNIFPWEENFSLGGKFERGASLSTQRRSACNLAFISWWYRSPKKNQLPTSYWNIEYKCMEYAVELLKYFSLLWKKERDKTNHVYSFFNITKGLSSFVKAPQETRDL